MIGRLLLRILQAKDVQPDDLCILTPYTAQRSRIRKEITGLRMVTSHLTSQKFSSLVDQQTESALHSSVTCLEDTADLERELAIVSTTRSNSKLQELDLLGDPRSINTLLTRARRGLIIIGDIQSLSIDENWREWFFWANSNGILTTI